MPLEGKGIQNAEEYRQNSLVQWYWALETIDKYPWQGNERVLDIGCGDGKVTAYITRYLHSGVIVGIDVSQPMIQLSSSLFLPKEYPNLFFLKEDVIALPFIQQFDVVVSFLCLHWVMEQKLALENIYDSLVPEGKALLVVPLKHASNLSIASEQLANSSKWSSYFPDFKWQKVYYTEDEYITLLKEVGFQSAETRVSTIPIKFSYRQELIEWMRPQQLFIRHLPMDIQNCFLNDLADLLMLYHTIGDDGSIIYSTIKMEALAIK